LLTLRGLQDRDSGLLVAAPTTSIPQWPASERAWDYRYAWLRDCADAGIALAHAGASVEADAVARGVAALLGDHPETAGPVHRLSGGALPTEHFVDQLSGYAAARVRIGNGAAGQVQLDTLGEVARLAAELEADHGCPPELLAVVPALADAASTRWRQPDHGIWEVRGDPQDYVHSKVMAWTALQCAVDLADRGRIEGSTASWRGAARAIREAVGTRGQRSSGELVMSFQEPDADSALLAAYLVSYIDSREQNASRTLDAINRKLGRGPLMARHSPERDGISAPSFPFVFPGLWAATAEAILGRQAAAEARFQAICQLCGPAGQLSEVADPARSLLWGNFPQVQSHAALVDAALAIWPRPARGSQ
jgi:GH15 family glucan-1,4-alpha-glucosidase